MGESEILLPGGRSEKSHGVDVSRRVIRKLLDDEQGGVGKADQQAFHEYLL